ncbi:MAG: long-chain fatty acid--CoA ligase [Actinobacteria bacterium]|nr:long-chain fatty acid--CoA ligase [Actinomycetota bacterium]
MTATEEDITRAVDGRTVPAAFAMTVASRPDATALRWRDSDGWSELTWSAYAARVAALAGAFGGLGVRPGSRVMLLLRNRPEFHIADVAAQLLRATPISIYNSSSPDQIAYLVRHSEATVAVVEAMYLDGFLASGVFPEPVRNIVVVEHAAAAGGRVAWDDALASTPVDLDAAARAVEPSDIATVIYTSGTTGPPKGVVIDQANVMWTVESLRRALGGRDPTGSRVVSYLPMAHIAERMSSHYQGIVVGYEVTTCPEAGRVATYLPDVRPEIFFGVPRVWEKIHAGVQGVLASSPPDQQRRFADALELGRRVDEARAAGDEPRADLAAAVEEAEGSTLRPVRELLGLDQLLTGVSGAAPLSRDVLTFFRSLGVPLSEIYGLSESSGPLTWDPFRVRIGTVGRAIPGEEVRLGEDGEVMCRGGNVFRGYLDDPEKTAEAIDPEGWLHTGDIGVFDDDGYLRIVDRKKELIITAGGKNVSPANLEAALKSIPLIGQALVVGDEEPFIAALLLLDGEVAPSWAKARGLDDISLPALAANPDVIAEVQRGVDDAMRHFNQAERVKKFVLLGDEWLPDSDMLTPTMKLKRRAIHEKYAGEIASLYSR